MIDLPLVSLDLELLGSGDEAEIIEVGAVKFRGTETLGTFSALVRPVAPLSHRIGELTGLTARELGQAEPLAAVLPRLSQFIGGAPLVGQSIGIDVEHLRRAGLPLANPRLDTYELATLVRPGLRTYDLQSIARDLGVAAAAPHRALPDALLARDVFLALVEQVEGVDLNVLSQIGRLAGPLEWSLKLVFAEAQRAQVRALVDAPDAGRLLKAGALTAADPPSPRDPLSPNDGFVPLEPEELAASLSIGGRVASAVDGFEERPEQQAMLAAVASAFNDGRTLLVEAGTGTGKSLAYLLPALRFATANDRRVVISTSTINLQDQLCDKDLPDLLDATGMEARTTRLKGRDNYLCLQRCVTLLTSDDLSPAERMLLIRVLLWLPGTVTGDRAELKLSQREDEAWSRLAAVAEACSPLRCPFHRDGTCYVARARRAADSAHLIIVNHSLLLSDVMAGNQILPDYEHLVVDEAHHLEDEATSQLGRRVGEREIIRRLDDLAGGSNAAASGLLVDASAALRAAPRDARVEAGLQLVPRAEQEIKTLRSGMRALFRQLGALAKERGRPGEGGQTAARITRAARAQPAWSEVEVLWGEVGRAVLALERTLIDLGTKLEDRQPRDGRQASTAPELAAQAVFWHDAREHLNRVIAESDPSVVAWLALTSRGDVGVNAAPLHVGEVLNDQLISAKRTVILTSATLTTEGSFQYLRERLGLRDATELTVGSPFDYASSALVYLPTDLPEPNQPGYQRAVESVILDVATELSGRTLALFTSHSQLRATHTALRDPLDARRITLLGQRVDGSSRARLLESFRSGNPSVLLGTSSFWEGVDVVGPALSCLVIARLPFAPPSDPIVEARSELFDDPFSQYTVPQAILRFRQGFGRLIRSRTDRGVLIVLDRRLRSRRYGRAFLRSLPPCTVSSGPASHAGPAASEWLAASLVRSKVELGSARDEEAAQSRS